MYRLLLCGMVLMAAASMSLAADEKKDDANKGSATQETLTVQPVVINEPAPLNRALLIFIIINLGFLAIIIGQLVWMRGDLERLLGGSRPSSSGS